MGNSIHDPAAAPESDSIQTHQRLPMRIQKQMMLQSTKPDWSPIIASSVVKTLCNQNKSVYSIITLRRYHNNVK